MKLFSILIIGIVVYLINNDYYDGFCSFFNKSSRNSVTINVTKANPELVPESYDTLSFQYISDSLFFTHQTYGDDGTISFMGKTYRMGKDCLNHNFVSTIPTDMVTTEAAEVYDFWVANRHYVTISAFSAIVAEQKDDVVIFNLFDVTDSQDVKYYTLRSTSGESCNLGDFNHDGVLDFIRVKKSWDNTYYLTLYSLRNDDFVVYEDNLGWIYHVVLQETPKGLQKISGHWF
ncbi:MAG: hypothetical protein JNM36_15035 [Chitinophagales bacterium]|nr:hypothetical protein [Chitinophagales bacterium]